MDFEKIFSKAIKYPLNLQVFVLMFAVNAALSYSGFYIAALTNPSEITSLITVGVNLIPVAIISILITTFFMGLYIDNAAKYFSGGRKSLAASLPAAKKRFLRLLGTYLLVTAILLLAAMPLIAVVGLGSAGLSASGNILTVLAGMAIGFAVLFVAVFFVSLVPYIAVLGNAGVFGSIKASASVVRRNKLSMFIFWILYAIIAIGIGLLSLPVTFTYVIGSSADPIVLILESLISAYTTLFSYSAFANFWLSAKKK
ncbi:MAG: hypothetical protein HYT72_05305 [Candidatus Aenigmarchaeota archaeon]|nr:hypothetical protein [Candidatus Aenigmarchaeota archaeon]